MFFRAYNSQIQAFQFLLQKVYILLMYSNCMKNTIQSQGETLKLKENIILKHTFKQGIPNWNDEGKN